MKTGGKVTAALAVAVVLAVTVAGAELIARLMRKDSYLTGFLEMDRVFHHRIPPNYSGTMQSQGDFAVRFTTNNAGFRGPGDYTHQKEKDVYRIAVLGDSFTFGVGVKADETFSYKLGSLLNNGGRRKYEVYNFGINSYSPLLEYILLTQEVSGYRPDAVILMLDICDIQDDYLYEPGILTRNGRIVACDPLKVDGRFSLAAFLKRHSRLYYLLDQKLFDSFRKIRTLGCMRYLSNKIKGVRNKAEIYTLAGTDTIYFDRFLLCREHKDTDIVMRHWKRTARFITLIEKFLDDNNIRFVLAAYPYGHQVGEDEWSTGRAYWGFEKGTVSDPGPCFSVIRDFAETARIDYIDLSAPLIEAEKKGEKLYYDRDGHLTAAGHAAVAQALSEKLGQKGPGAD